MGRILIVLEGESLVNDAAALIALDFALTERRPVGLVPGLSFYGKPILATLLSRVAQWGQACRRVHRRI